MSLPSLRDVLRRILLIPQSLYWNIRSRLYAYGDLSPQFTIKNGVRQGCPFNFFLVNFVTEMKMGIARSTENKECNDFHPESKQSDFGYAGSVLWEKTEAGWRFFSIGEIILGRVESFVPSKQTFVIPTVISQEVIYRSYREIDWRLLIWNMWRLCDNKSLIKGGVAHEVALSTLFCGSATWPLRTTNLRRLSTKENRCFCARTPPTASLNHII